MSPRQRLHPGFSWLGDGGASLNTPMRMLPPPPNPSLRDTQKTPRFQKPLGPDSYNFTSSTPSRGNSTPSSRSRISRRGGRPNQQSSNRARHSSPPESADSNSPPQFTRNLPPAPSTGTELPPLDTAKIWKLVKSSAYTEAVLTFFPPFDLAALQKIVLLASKKYAEGEEAVPTGE